MLNIFSEIVSTLKGDATLNSLIPPTNIMVGPVDITQELQSQLTMPQINMFLVSESVRTVPQGVRDTTVQLDIWSRVSQIEIENIYERVLSLLDFLSTDSSGTHIFWQRLGSANDQFETDRRIWHRACTFVVWAQ